MSRATNKRGGVERQVYKYNLQGFTEHYFCLSHMIALLMVCLSSRQRGGERTVRGD